MADLAAVAARIKSASAHATPPFSLAIFSDAARLSAPAPVLRLAPAGAAFIYRDYGAPMRARRARHLRELCRARRIFFLVGADVELAAALNADGVHLPEGLMDEAPRLRARFPILTGACHSPEALARAGALGLNAAFLSPVFETLSHPGAAALGPDRAGAMARAAGLPVMALGGVDARKARALMGRGFSGFGAIGAFS